MSEKNGNNLFVYFGLVLLILACIAFFFFDDSKHFQFFDELFGKTMRCVTVAAIGLTFFAIGLSAKIKLKNTK